MTDDALLTTSEAAGYLRVHPATLHRWAAAGTGPTRIGSGKLVRYRKTDLDAYLATTTTENQEQPR